MAPQQATLGESSSAASGSTRMASAGGSSKPACSPSASGGGESTDAASGRASGSGSASASASGSGGPGSLTGGCASAATSGTSGLSSDISGISYFTAVSSAGKLDSLDDPATQRPKTEALKAWTSASQKAQASGAPAAAGATSSEPHATDLDCFHAEARIEHSLQTGHYAKIRSLSDCCRNEGKVELHRWHEAEREEDRIVVVKRIISRRVYANCGLEANECAVHRKRVQRDSEDTLTEIGVYSLLARQRDLPEYLLRMHTAFEAGPDVWLVLEHADGGDLFGVMQQADCGQGLPQDRLVRWMWQLMHAVDYLHRHGIGHRDISMENVLLRKDTVKLMDFGQAVRTHSAEGTALRYFTPAGKPYYRGPECYVPTKSEVQVVVPAGARPGDLVFARTAKGECILEVRLAPSSGAPLALVPGSLSIAEPFGYAAAPADIFACGVVLFILATGLPPWRQATPSDPHFAYSFTKGISHLLQAWKRQLPAAEQDLMLSMMRWDPSKRPTAQDCLAHQWFAPLHGSPVPTHFAAAAPEPAAAPAAPVPAAEAGHQAAEAGRQADLARLMQGLTAGGASAGAGGDAYADGEGEWGHLMHQWGELVDNTGHSADYYCRPEVCRGEAEGLEAFHAMDSLAPAAGDFYGSLADECTELGAGVDAAVREPPVPLGLPFQLELARHGAGAAAASCPAERFSDEAVPPAAPEAEGFRFEPTTLHVSGSTPADVGNHLLAFLATVAGAEITKVNCRKFTMKASFQGDAGSCSLKLRLYSEGADKQAAEFQRRSGDAMALHLLYQRAVEYLERLVRALSPDGDSRPSSQGSDRSEVDAAPLQSWADPGVKGLLKRNRRQQLSARGPDSQPGGKPGGAPAPLGGCRGYGRQLVLAR